MDVEPRRPRAALGRLSVVAFAAAAALAVSTPPARAPRAAADPPVVIEDWSTAPLSHHGIPPGWTGEALGKRALFDLTIVEDQGRRALLLRSRDDRSTIAKDIKGRVTLSASPVLVWSWKAVTLPPGGDARRRETTDHAAQVYVVWPRFPALLRSRIIGYVWDTTAPAGAILRSRKAPTVTFVIVRSGSAQLGRWLTEQRNVWEDYRRIFGTDPEDPGAVSISIDSDDTHASAESMVGAIEFRAPASRAATSPRARHRAIGTPTTLPHSVHDPS